jgi:outer membrane usher protein
MDLPYKLKTSQLLVIKAIFLIGLCGISHAGDMAPLQEFWLLPQVNKQAFANSAILCLRDTNGGVFISANDWRKLKLRAPNTSPVFYRQQPYYEINHIEGVVYRVNEIDSTLELMVNARFFEANQFNATAQNTELPSVNTALGAYINYDLASSYFNETFTQKAFLEGVVFNRFGVFENQLIANDANKKIKTTRLNTTFIQDNPQQLTTLKIGDAITTDIGLGSNVRFAGLQWGSNFALQPNKITFPQPTMTGVATLPSTADIFVNNAKRLNQKLPVGSFAIQNLPVVTGRGEARMVVTDLLGQEQEVVMPYYVSPQSLKAGLTDYAVQLGVVRENYGIDSQNYGKAFVSGVHRAGINPQLTVEIEGQLSAHQQMLSYGTVLTHQKLGAFNGVAAVSSYKNQMGTALNLSFEHQQDTFNTGVNLKKQSRDYTNIGSFDNQLPTQYLGQVFASVPLTQRGTLSGSYTYQKQYDTPKFDFLQANYSMNLVRWGVLSTAVTHTFAQKEDTIVQINYSLPLGSATNAYVMVQPEQQRRRLSIQRSIQTGTGFGYTVAAERGVIDRDEATINLQNTIGTYSLRASQQQQEVVTEARMAGSAIFLAGEAFLGRRIDKSFAVVSVPDFPNVRVYHDNRLIGKTSQQGSVLIPQLRPYQKNALRINVDDLPIDTQINSAVIDVSPAFKSGLHVAFPIKRAFGASLTLMRSNGQAVPAGAMIFNTNTREAFPVGLQGMTYLTGLSTTAQDFMVRWQNESCQFQVALKTLNETQSNLGRYTCLTPKEATP